MVVYVDYENLRHSPKHAFGEDPLELSPIKLGNLLVGRRLEVSNLAEIRVYRGKPANKEHDDKARRQSKWEQRHAQDSRVVMVTRQMHYGIKRGRRVGREKGIDVSLAIDFVLHPVRRPNDAAILVTRDADLVPALEAFDQISGGRTPFEIASVKGLNRLHLATRDRPWCHYLSREDFEAIRDEASRD